MAELKAQADSSRLAQLRQTAEQQIASHAAQADSHPSHHSLQQQAEETRIQRLREEERVKLSGLEQTVNLDQHHRLEEDEDDEIARMFLG